MARRSGPDHAASVTNPLWVLLQDYMDYAGHIYSIRPADLARDSGVSEQLLSKWKSKPMLPSSEQLEKIAKATRISYFALLEAAIRGKGYLPDNYGISAERVEDPADETDQTRLRFRRYRAIDEAWMRRYEERSGSDRGAQRAAEDAEVDRAMKASPVGHKSPAEPHKDAQDEPRETSG